MKPSASLPVSATKQTRAPLFYTAMNLSHVAPGPRLAAENGRILQGLLIAAPLSLGLWLLIWIIVAG